MRTPADIQVPKVIITGRYTSSLALMAARAFAPKLADWWEPRGDRVLAQLTGAAQARLELAR